MHDPHTGSEGAPHHLHQMSFVLQTQPSRHAHMPCRWEAYDRLGTFVIYVMSFVLAIQAIGLEVTSVLAIGGGLGVLTCCLLTWACELAWRSHPRWLSEVGWSSSRVACSHVRVNWTCPWGVCSSMHVWAGG